MKSERKVYILTFQRALNYGAVLQCVALSKTISKYAKCEVIDYYSPSIEQRYKVFRRNASFKEIIKSLVLIHSTKIKRKKFSSFLRDNVTLTEKLRGFSDLKNRAWEKDAVFCVGSDQVWNVDLTKKDDAYILRFADKWKRFSYAASIGKHIDHDTAHYLKEGLRSFTEISVREETARKELNSAQIDCHTDIDPVFLLNVDEWKKIAILPHCDKYILVYLLQKSDSFMNKIMKYADQTGLKVIIITTGLRRNYKATYVDNCSPQEFIGYFLQADIVFTNSFHGISFAIMANKPFFYELQAKSETNSRNSRLTDIIETFGLEECNVAKYDSIPMKIDVKASQRDSIIDVKRREAKAYIQRMTFVME